MAITKVMGIETEYGITVPGSPDSNPVLASSLLVNAFSGRGRKVRWDYEEESPLRDARGFEAPREPEVPSEDDLGLANVILTNGARYYVDHAHPEYSSPECLDPRTLVVFDKAGERILAESARRAVELAPGGRRIQVYKNNTDGKGTSYGTHENFLVDRATPFARIVRDLTPFLVSRQVFAGAGSLVRDPSDSSVAYQIAQRSQFFEVEVGLETTLKRPIINTRDEPHADPERYRRLHVIIGDANMNEVATFLKTGSLAIVLCMIEDGTLSGDEWQGRQEWTRHPKGEPPIPNRKGQRSVYALVSTITQEKSSNGVTRFHLHRRLHFMASGPEATRSRILGAVFSA
jgi:hypothetical protein